MARHGGANGRGALGRVPAAAGGGISGEGRAELLGPDSGISRRCGWVEERSAVPSGEREALGDGVSPAVVKLEEGQWPVRAALSVAAGSERHSDAPSVGQAELVWLCH